jgi:predicted dehydrogenase
MTNTGLQMASSPSSPRLGFLGVGWIGQHRMRAVADAGIADISFLCEPNPDMIDKALEIVPEAKKADSLGQLLESGIDGLVIATPSAMHAEQAIAALEKGISVFCQKPLGRTQHETRRIVEAARSSDRLLGVDFSYRFINGVDLMRSAIQSGELGSVFSADLVFHNAYGPDKEWFFSRELSGGGCMIDLGVHLVDLAMWMLGADGVDKVTSTLFSKGRRLRGRSSEVEDFGNARIDLDNGSTINVTCSWNLHAGLEAEIEAAFYGTGGGVRLSNFNGSFYEFTTERMSGTTLQHLGSEHDWDWGGRAILDWTKRLADRQGFDPACEEFINTAAVLDAIYENAA